MIRADVLKILVCPENQSPLALASHDLIDRLNRAVVQGALKNRGDRTVEQPLAGGLVRADGAVLYPIVDEIPLLLVDESIRLDQPALTA